MKHQESDAAAGRWFAVRAEYERIGRARMALLLAKEFVHGLLTWGLNWGDFDPKRFCDVIVLRRDTGAPVATYSYDRLSEATGHFENLRLRLDTTQVYDFCRELGIGVDAVAGPGMSSDSDVQARWVPIATRLRGQS